MCRLALSDHLTNHLGIANQPLILDSVFATGPHEKAAADGRLHEVGLWPVLDHHLREITVVDPACGAGSFLIGMFRLLDELRGRASPWLGEVAESAATRRRRIVTSNLFGVDVKPWATQATAIRLWCACMSDDGCGCPSLPISALSRNLRVGDSLLRGVVGSVWDTAFHEIVQGVDGGFDVVIGNPPYVRHENIADPCRPAGESGAYKALVARSLQRALGIDQIDAKSDLYVYFVYRGLSLLNRRGTFCFLTSNAWLDARYGAALQDFLLRRCRLKLVLDNPTERSFAQADVNTVILLASAPGPDGSPVLDHAVRFATLRTPFKQAANAGLVRRLVESTDHAATDEAQVRPVSQRALLEERVITGGGKWGGKYLRAPDIYRAIVEKGRMALRPLSAFVDYRYGIKPGAIDFFALTAEDAARWEIEPTFLNPFVRSSLGLSTIEIETSDVLFSCSAPREALAGTAALRYIEWGESLGYHQSPSVRSHRPVWYAVRGLPVDVLLLQFWDRRFWTPVARGEL
jgi:hypothetical protein